MPGLWPRPKRTARGLVAAGTPVPELPRCHTAEGELADRANAAARGRRAVRVRDPGPSANGARGSQVRAGSSCDTAVAAAPVLGAVSQAAVPVPGRPFSVVATADGRWSFVTLNSAVEVLSNRSPALVADRQVSVPGTPQGEQLTNDGRYLLVADGSGAVVIDVARAADGAAGAVLGTLSSPAGRGAVEVAVSPDDRFAFVTLDWRCPVTASAPRPDPGRRLPQGNDRDPAHGHAARHRLPGRAGPGGQPGHGALVSPSSASGPGSRPCCTANIAAAVRLEAPILA